MKQQLLLLQDVDALGKKGEIVSAKPGYVRNFLLPRGFAVVATSNMLRKQESLRAERAKQAIIDRKESEELAARIESISLETKVKVDPEGHMYGSVSAGDIAHLFQEQGLSIEKKSVLVTKPIKETGVHKISVKLKEGITATCQLSIRPEGVVQTGVEAVTAPLPTDEKEAEKSE
jgi:large subunit ribosomal protein L9